MKRVAGREMATRLSYLFWQTMPDAALFQAADAGMLDTKDGVPQQAQKMLDDPRSHPTVAFFFDNLLPIPDLSGLTRDATLFPTWSSSIGRRDAVGGAARSSSTRSTRTRRRSAPPYVPGSWPAILTAPYTFVNQALFNYYGASTFAPGTTRDGHGAHEGRPQHHAAARAADPGRNDGRLDDQQTSRTRCCAAASSSTS